MIFVFIAGTYTPFALLAMPERTGRSLLAVVWVGALGGVLLKTSWTAAPRWLCVPLYLGLGWVAVFVLPSLLHQVGVAAFVLITAGGLLYTFGGDRVRAASARPVAAHVRLPRGVPPVHRGRRDLPHGRGLARRLLAPGETSTRTLTALRPSIAR